MVAIRSIIFTFAFCSQVFGAASIALEKSTSDGVLQNAFTVDKKRALFVKNTNYFDPSDLSVGKYEITNPKELKKALKKLKELHAALERAETKFPDIVKNEEATPHQERFKIGKYVIDPGHPYFKDAKQVFDALKFQSKLKELDVLELDLGKQPVKRVVKAGKETEKSLFDLNFSCESREKGKMCEFKEHGLLFLKQP